MTPEPEDAGSKTNPIGYGHLAGYGARDLFRNVVAELAEFNELLMPEVVDGVVDYKAGVRAHPDEAAGVIGAIQAFLLRVKMEASRGNN